MHEVRACCPSHEVTQRTSKGILRRTGAVVLAVAMATGFLVGSWSEAVGASSEVPEDPVVLFSDTAGSDTTTPPPQPPPPPPPTTTPKPAPAPPPPPPPPPPPAPAPPPPPVLNPRDWAVNHLHVDLRHQRVNVIANNGWNLRSMPMSSGANGKTPRGTFHVYSRSASTVSTTDRRVSMRYMTRFRGGIGFHGIPRRGGVALHTPLGQYPVSAGCVRMADHDAQWIFHNIPNGTRIVVK